jgi:hypothetical protein
MRFLTTDGLIDAARSTSGLEEFDSDSFVEPLGILVDGVNSHSEGPRIATRLQREIVRLLANRLKVAEYLRRHPELYDAPLDVPVVVIGMPRTGTTMVSNLLACDPRWRSLLNWEAVDSVPPPTTDTLRTDPRCLEAKAFQQAFLATLPFSPPHWEWADGPTECNYLHAQDFKSLIWHARVPDRAYNDYILTCDMASAYEYQHRILRVLQSQAPGRWALKMPSHALHFRWALEAFPDARFVWMHRNPYRALASMGLAMATAHRMEFGGVDADFVHDVCPRMAAEHVNRPARLRASLPDDKILDISCRDLTRDPAGEMRRIYDWLGEDFTPDLERAMLDWRAADNARQRARPQYSLEDFGWTEIEVAPLFEEYLANYPFAKDS